MKRLAIVTTIFSALAATAVPAAACTLSIGWESSEPFAFKTAAGTLKGLDTEIAEAVAARAGCKAEFKEEPWARTLKGIETGDTAMAMNASQTPEREVYARFTRAYRQEAMVLVVAAGASVKTLKEALTQGTVGVVNGYEYGADIKAAMTAADTGKAFEPTSNDDINLKKLAAGRLSAAVVDPYIAAARIRALDLTGAVAVVSPPVHASGVAIIVSKKAGEDLFRRVDDAVAALQADGTLNRILNTYAAGS